MLHFGQPAPYEIRRNIHLPEAVGVYCGSVALAALKFEWKELHVEGEPVLLTSSHIVLLSHSEIEAAFAHTSPHGDVNRKTAWQVRANLKRKTNLIKTNSVVWPEMITGVALEHAEQNTTLLVRFKDDNPQKEENLCHERLVYLKTLEAYAHHPLTMEPDVSLPFARIPRKLGEIIVNESTTLEEHLREYTDNALEIAQQVRGNGTMEPFTVLPPQLVKIHA